MLEPRLLLTAATVLSEPVFRTDAFQYTSRFDFDLVSPFDYRDSISNGLQTSTSASVTWSNPVEGSGSIFAETKGTGSAEFFDIDRWLPCADYTFTSTGTYKFDINAETEIVTMTDKSEGHSEYDPYVGYADGCEEPEFPFDYAFGGSLDGYSGTFDLETYDVNIGYDRFHGDTHIVVTSEVISSGPLNSDPGAFMMALAPVGVEDSRGVPGVDFLDSVHDRIDVTVDFSGIAIPPIDGDVWTPVAQVRLFWADADMNKFEDGELEVNGNENLNVYWNTSQIHVEVDDLSPPSTHVEYLLVELDVANGTGIEDQTRAILVNDLPFAAAGGPYSVDEGSSLVLDGSGSFDVNQTQASLLFEWDLDNDGVFGEVGSGAERGSERGRNPEFLMADVDGSDDSIFDIALRVTDDRGNTDTDVTKVTVANVAPKLSSFEQSDYEIDENGEVTLSGTFTDPGLFDTHQVTIDWGDSSEITVVQLTVDERSFTATHRYLDNPPIEVFTSTYLIALSVSDDDGGKDAVSTTIQVNNVAPELSPLIQSDYEIDENGAVTLSGTFTDPGSVDEHQVTVNWGDSSENTVLQLTIGDRSFTATHLYLDNHPSGIDGATYSIAVSLIDDEGGEDTASTTILVNNVAPTPSIDSISANRVEGSPIDFSGSATDPAGVNDTLTYIWDFGDGSPAASGQDVSHTYADNANYAVVLTVRDEDGGEATATQVIPVLNADPTPSINSISANRVEGSPIDFSGSATDPAGMNDTLTYLWDFGDGTQTAIGQNIRHTFTDNANYTITLTVRDEDGGEASTSQTISVRNAAPTPSINSISAVRVEGSSINFRGSATDPAGSNDTLTYVWDFGDGSSAASGRNVSHTYADNANYRITLTVRDEDGGRATITRTISVLNADPSPGIDSISANRVEGGLMAFSGSATDPAGSNDMLTYEWDFGDGSSAASGRNVSHTYADNADYTATLTVRDEDGGRATATQMISVSNLDPALTVNTSNVLMEQGTSTSKAITTADVAADTVSVTASIGTIVDNGNGMWTWNYVAADGPGIHTVTIEATDEDGGLTNATFNLTVTQSGGSDTEPPVVTVPADIFVTANRGQDTALVTFDVTATDNVAVAEVTSSPESGSEFPVGTTLVTTTATDTSGNTSTASFHVTVAGIGVDNGTLNIVGTEGPDVVTILRLSASRIVVLSNTLGIVAVDPAVFETIHVQLGGGNDTFNAPGNFGNRLIVDGGAGNDSLLGSRGGDVLLGGAGNDFLWARGGNNVVIGGTGRDVLFGGSGQDILIGGMTSFDSNSNVLGNIRDEWNSGGNLQDRVRNLSNFGEGGGNGLNGNNYLKAETSTSAGTVQSDNERDLLFGAGQIDWLFFDKDSDIAIGTLRDLLGNDLDDLFG